MKDLAALYRQRFASEPTDIQPLPISGSHRAYYRLSGPRGAIGVVGTDPDENRAFLVLSRHFRSKGLPVPEIYAVSPDGMRYLQEDLGSLSLYDAVRAGRESGRYNDEEKSLLRKAIRLLPRLQFEGAEGLDFSVCYPQKELDGRMVDFDLNYFKYDYLKLSGLEFNEVRLQDDFDRLKQDLLAVPAEGFLYRDFQGRNILLRDGEPWLIDYQGGRRGPCYYDLASFVFQAKARYDAALREELIDAYRQELSRYRDIPEETFRRELRIFVLFRLLQVLGCYGFRGLIEGKAYFIESIPFALAELRELLPFPEYPYLSALLTTLCQEREKRPMLTVEIQSFSYKKGLPVDASGHGGGYIFDCRSVHNPGKYAAYKQLSGLDQAVIDFLEQDGEILRFLDSVYRLVDAHVERYLERGFDHLQVSFGCTGGQHRSAYSAESLAAHLAARYPVRIRLRHRELGIEKEMQGKEAPSHVNG